MSGIATLLLAVHCKKTDSVDLKGPLLSYIRNSFSDQQANEAADDLSTLQALRNEVAGLTGTLPHLREQLAK
jgi:programmed cell death 6-interacting protein